MASQRITIERVATKRPDYFVKTTVWYNNGSLQRSDRGYCGTVSVIKQDGETELTCLFGPGNRVVKLQSAARFSAKDFDSCVVAAKQGFIIPLNEAMTAVKAIADTVNM